MASDANDKYDLGLHGIKNVGNVYHNLCTPGLYEWIVRHRDGIIGHLGPVIVRTGNYTGRAANDKFIVREPSSTDKIWWGDVNFPFENSRFESIKLRQAAYLQGKDLFIQDCYAGADPEYRISTRIITETAWHSLFARNMLIQIHDSDQLAAFTPDYTVIHTPHFFTVPEIDGTNSQAFILINFGSREVLIGGTAYGGEIKKSVFTILNYLLPQKGILAMHCSANMGAESDVALFFGLSGTGKTTLSTDPARSIIGDDEHGWSDNGIFNFEGGCYAKVIRLSAEAEPDIYQCTRRFGTILENVMVNYENRRLDLDDDVLTENTRAAFPLSHLSNPVIPAVGGHPSNIIMLTCDAFGVMPPVARLTPSQAVYHFLSGYTAKVAGTEAGIEEPQATFSTCFGAPFMSLHPTVYAKLLGEKIERHRPNCWLINTGWSGGSYGIGKRVPIAYTRAMVNAALYGKLDKQTFRKDPVFGLDVPQTCPGVPETILDPVQTWKDKSAYKEKAGELASLFIENFKSFAKDVSDEIKNASPRI